MKKALKILNSFLIILFTFLTIFSLLYYYITSKRFMYDVLNRTDYYSMAYNQIIKDMKELTINDSLNNEIDNIITEDKVKQDINKMVDSLYKDENIKDKIKSETNELINNSFTNILKDSEFDTNNLNELTDTLTNSYLKNLFPYTEYKKLETKIIPISYLIPISIFFILITILLSLFSLIINKNPYQILCRSNFIVGITLLFPFCFCHLYKLFDTFYYSNGYFSALIKNTFYIIINLLDILGFLFIIYAFILELLFIKRGVKKYEKNK